MPNISITLFESLTPNQSGNPIVLPYESIKAKGCGYNGQTNGLHTVQYAVSLFDGEIVIQGALEVKPTEDDWFDIDSAKLSTAVGTTVSTTTATNFAGNFVWVRAVITRFAAGSINRVLFTHN